ncbi:MAG: hypothetical protein ACYDAQ_12500 [Mycobacteriales bacterium]
MRRVLAALLLAVGVVMVLLPAVTGMWVRAPRGGDMINSFKPIMTQQNVTLFTDNYMPTLALGFGNVPGAMGDASQAFAHQPLSYQQAANYLSSQPSLSNLSYLQQNFATIAVPFTSMLAVMNSDRGAFHSLTGLPPFLLFPYFFVLPGLILAACSVAVLRGGTQRRLGTPVRGGTTPVRGGTTPVRGGTTPVRVMLVIGVFLVAAPFLPMPPGFHSIWSVAPQGGRMVADFASPVDPGGPPIMSAATVRMFDGYLAQMKGAQTEILPAIQGQLAAEGHPVSVGQVESVIAGQPSLSQLHTVLTNFPTMYAKFRNMLRRMGANLGNYAAVRALPAFPDFPYLFLIPGLVVVVAAGLLARGRIPEAAGSASPPAGVGPSGVGPSAGGPSRAEAMVARMLADRDAGAHPAATGPPA